MALAGLALFFAIGGPSFASDAVGNATRLITGKQIKNNSLTTRDIKNRSLLKVDFKAGQLPAGSQGPKGDKGDQGAQGDTGPAGPFPDGTVPSGKTLRGVYMVVAPGGFGAADTHSFIFTLSAAPTTHFISVTGSAPAECPYVPNPRPAPGHLCVYETGSTNGASVSVVNPETNNAAFASPRGFAVVVAPSGPSGASSNGSWAVTAP